MPSELEPVPLSVLAEHIRDRTWLDMRVIEVGTCQRVQITQLNIYREHDEIAVRQKRPVNDELIVDVHTFDAENVRWVRETRVAIEDVTPILGSRPIRPESQLASSLIIAHIVSTVSRSHEVPEQLLLNHQKLEPRALLTARQICLRLIYEMTDMSAVSICEGTFNYASQQALVTASERAHRDMVFRTELRGTAQLVDAALGGKHRRFSSTGSRPIWRPVL